MFISERMRLDQAVSDQIIALHQQIRELVEEDLEGFRVTRIDSYANTDYQRPLMPSSPLIPGTVPEPEYVLAYTGLRFRVVLVHEHSGQSKTVNLDVTSDGRLVPSRVV